MYYEFGTEFDQINHQWNILRELGFVSSVRQFDFGLNAVQEFVKLIVPVLQGAPMNGDVPGLHLWYQEIELPAHVWEYGSILELLVNIL